VKPKLLKTLKHYGNYTAFITLSFNDTANPVSFWASFHTISNRAFPAVFEQDGIQGSNGSEFMQYLLSASVEEARTNILVALMGHDARVQAAIDNPVAYVMESKRMLLMWWKAKNVAWFSVTTSWKDGWRFFQLRWSQGGLNISEIKKEFGSLSGAVVITEDYNKGTLHYHMLMAGGLNGYVLQCFHAISELSSTISSVLGKMQTSTLCDEFFIAHALQKNLRENNTYEFDMHKELSIPLHHLLERDNLMSVLDPNGAVIYAAICDKISNHVRTQQMHGHMSICEKDTLGRTGCRMYFGWQHYYTTHPIMLVALQEQLKATSMEGDTSNTNNSESSTTDIVDSDTDEEESSEKEQTVYLCITACLFN